MPVAIDIGTRALRVVQGKASKQNVAIKKAIIEPLPAGVVQDGIIREYGGMEMALKNMLAKYKIKEKPCMITLNGSHVYSRELDVPSGKRKMIDDVVTFEVQSAIGNGKEVAVEYVRSKQRVIDKPEMLHVRASAIQVEYINNYHKLLKNCGLKPTALDIHPNALTKAIANTTINGKVQKENSGLMLIDMGAVSTTAYVMLNGEIIYSRILPNGGIDIERYVTTHNEESPSDQQLDISRLDLSLENLRTNEDLANAVRPLVTSINDGIQRIQQFVAGRLQGSRVEQVYLYGRTSLYHNLDRTLSEAFGFPAQTITSLGNVKMPADQPVAPFVNAIGALIRHD